LRDGRLCEVPRPHVDQLSIEAFAGFGYFEEKNASLYFEGAEGADKIAFARILCRKTAW